MTEVVSVLRLIATQQWTMMDTHSNKTTYKLTVLKPDTTYQVKVLTQCLSKLHKSNEVITVRTPDGREYREIILQFVSLDSLCLSQCFSLVVVIMVWQFDI